MLNRELPRVLVLERTGLTSGELTRLVTAGLFPLPHSASGHEAWWSDDIATWLLQGRRVNWIARC